MGTFAGMFCEKACIVPEEKREEFAKRVEKVFQAGGMMEVDWVQLKGKRVTMIRKAQMNQEGLDCTYNYFEDKHWENAGFDREDDIVWSGKIGWRAFHRAVVTAYVLRELYLEGIAVTKVDGVAVSSWNYVGWINYLFHERYHVKNLDPWKLFEAMYYDDGEDEEYTQWDKFSGPGYAFIGTCEIYAVKYGVEEAIKRFDKVYKGKTENYAYEFMKKAIEIAKQYVEKYPSDQENQLKEWMRLIRLYYEQSSENSTWDISEDEKYKPLMICLYISDAPVFIVKALSEVYGKNFWSLWEEIRDVVARKNTDFYGGERYYVKPVSTAEFFKLKPEDMIPYWEEGGDFALTEKLWDWFKDLKEDFDAITEEDLVIAEPLTYILGLMEEAEENYYQIYTFAEFFEETLEHLQDKRYLRLWKLYEEMLRDPELKAAWEASRVSLRGYMALVANRKLREKVFGF